MMDNLRFALQGGWQVLWVSLLLGAGLPVLFAVGVRSLAVGDGGTTTAGHAREVPASPAASLLGKVVAVICFAVILIAVGLGITVIVAAGLGKEVSFEHVYPTLVPKS